MSLSNDLNHQKARFLNNHHNGQSGVVQPLLTDLYQITMAYALWRTGKSENRAVYNLFFRRNPFQGEFTIFCGLEECLKFLENFKYSQSDVAYLKTVLPSTVEDEFYTCLLNLDSRDVTLCAVEEGSVAFPRVPLIQLEGPQIMMQLLETTLLTLVNYASLVATNAARFRLAAGYDKQLLEFGLRRAQGPDGGLSASKYCFVGGFDATSNVLAGKMFGIPVKGTLAHAFVSSYSGLQELTHRILIRNDGSGTSADLLELSVSWREKIAKTMGVLAEQANDGELAAFVSYALSFPKGFLALVDTYDTIRSGVLNYAAVALALNELGYHPIGIRIDSGDLAYLSKTARNIFKNIAKAHNFPSFEHSVIVASNDINEDTLYSLREQGHSIDCYGVGTHLVTCQKQPALGCVYKLVEIENEPKIKLSQDIEKVTIPGKKKFIDCVAKMELIVVSGKALIDLISRTNEKPPSPGMKVLCRHPFQEAKRAFVVPAKVETLLKPFWRNGQICQTMPNLAELRGRVQESLNSLREDHKRNLNPTPYKVSVTDKLYHFLHDMWLMNAPIGELY